MAAHRKRRHDETRGFTAGEAAAEHGMSNGELPDLSAMQADDALLDALGSGNPDVSGSLSGEQVNELLLAWRREVDAEPVAELVDTDTAARVVAEARAGGRKKRRLLVPLTSAAAVLVIAFGVVGFAARSAQPGDTLWGVTQVLYSDHARSVQAANSARADLNHVRALLREGRTAEAQGLLDRMESLDDVRDEDGRRDLRAERARLREQSRDGGTPTTGQQTSGRTPSPSTPRPAPAPPTEPQNPAPDDTTSQTGPTSPPEDTTPPPDDPTSPPTSTVKPPTDSAPGDGDHSPAPGSSSGKQPSTPSDDQPLPSATDGILPTP